MDKDEFAKKVDLKYGSGRYAVLGDYRNNKSKVLVKCNVCGYEWEVNAGNFINACKVGCPKCALRKSHDEFKLSTEEIIDRGKELYGDRYSYDKVDSLNRDKDGKVCFTCNVCGEDFWERPSLFLSCRRSKFNCPNCFRKNRDANIAKKKERHEKYVSNCVHDTESFIKRINEKFPDFYDTSETEYVNSTTNLTLIHDGHKIVTTPVSILAKNKPILQNMAYDTESFIRKAVSVHGGKYGYSKVEYKDAKTKVLITCPVHGDFLQTPNNHLNGNGCPVCKNSRLESGIKNALDNVGIGFVEKYKSEWLGAQHLDFYLPDYNIGIECQGIQHFKNSKWFADSLEKTIHRDVVKHEKCKERLSLLYFLDKGISKKRVISEDKYGGIYSEENTFKDFELLLKRIKN